MKVKSFEEFHTARKRRRGLEAAATSASTLKKKQNIDDTLQHDSSTRKEGSPMTLGKMVEFQECQLAVIVLIYFDILVTTVELLLSSKEYGIDEIEDSVVFRIIQSFSGFTQFLFLFEIVSLVVAFRRLFFSHIGYLLDFVIVCTSIYRECVGFGKVARLLGFLRIVWRVSRLVNSMVRAANIKHEKVNLILQQEKKKMQSLKMELMRQTESISREVDAKKQVEKMLQGYKDEVETLREALNIAAYDISLASRDDILNRSGEETLMGDNGSVFFDSSDNENNSDSREISAKKS